MSDPEDWSNNPVKVRIKSYFVKSIAEALGKARTELGDEALLLSSRRVEAHTDTPGQFEIVFGTPGSVESEGEPGEAAVAKPWTIETPPERSNRLVELPNRDEPGNNLQHVHAQILEIYGLLSSEETAANGRRLPAMSAVYSNLCEAGFDAELAGQIVAGMETAMSAAKPEEKGLISIARKSGRAEVHELLRQELAARVKIDGRVGVEGSGSIVVALVGPAGVGKTTMLMKLAAFQGAPTRPVRLLTLDSSGLGDRVQLQFFARQTGITFTSLDSPEALPAAVHEARRTEIVLIDTPSHLAPADRERLAGALADCGHVDVHLAVPGYMAASSVREAIRTFRIFQPTKLALTKIDETTAFGSPVSEAVRAGLSLSFISNGASVPADLHTVSVETLMSMALPGLARVASA